MAGSKKPTVTAMMAITTSSSIIVSAVRRRLEMGRMGRLLREDVRMTGAKQCDVKQT
jgi:hypothetical protein